MKKIRLKTWMMTIVKFTRFFGIILPEIWENIVLKLRDEFREHFYWFEKFSQNIWENLVTPQIWGQRCPQIWE